eukprot:3061781-Amphidinium_carterae.1
MPAIGLVRWYLDRSCDLVQSLFARTPPAQAVVNRSAPARIPFTRTSHLFSGGHQVMNPDSKNVMLLPFLKFVGQSEGRK